jgi:hypothetical protein
VNLWSSSTFTVRAISIILTLISRTLFSLHWSIIIQKWCKVRWILIACERITVTGVKKCCISNALDGTEEDFLWKDDENKDSDCEEDGDGDEQQSENKNSE